METFYGILIPFLGTSLGAACVFFLKKTLSDAVQRALTGFAAGVMVAASVWSLLIPAIAQSAALGRWSFLPAALGFWVGILFLLALDHIIPHLHAKSGQAEGPKSRLQRTTMMVLAVTLHNIPEGMAVGVVYAGYLSGQAQITAAGALALSLGIAIQNFPEGAIISLPLRAEGMKKSRAFLDGVLSGAGYQNRVNRFYSEENRCMNVGQCFAALDPTLIADDSFYDTVDDYILALHASGEAVLYPGEREQAAYEEAMRGGVALSEETAAALRGICGAEHRMGVLVKHGA